MTLRGRCSGTIWRFLLPFPLRGEAPRRAGVIVEPDHRARSGWNQPRLRALPLLPGDNVFFLRRGVPLAGIMDDGLRKVGEP